jgi:hypothetical protein
MRTTATFTSDNAVRLKRLSKKRGQKFKDVLNDVVRTGLDAVEAEPKRRQPFKIRVFDAGKPLFNSPEELKKLIGDIQEEEDLEKMRRSGF